MQFLVCLEMKIAGSAALCAHIGIWNFPGYQQKGRAYLLEGFVNL